MKIVFASTPSQKEEINGMVRGIYSTIFPLYFTDEEISQFEWLKVLHTSDNHFEHFTLKDAFQVMSSIQTVVSILESTPLEKQYEPLFNKNVENLQDFGLFFPFEFSQFEEVSGMKNAMLSLYTKADNELPV
ncbi:MAG: YhcU family protein [Bacillus sp. (in: Bacteria)]|nr:YhcU family protein [Bacillus sp. (in: firmicutes)]